MIANPLCNLWVIALRVSSTHRASSRWWLISRVGGRWSGSRGCSTLHVRVVGVAMSSRTGGRLVATRRRAENATNNSTNKSTDKAFSLSGRRSSSLMLRMGSIVSSRRSSLGETRSIMTTALGHSAEEDNKEPESKISRKKRSRQSSKSINVSTSTLCLITKPVSSHKDHDNLSDSKRNVQSHALVVHENVACSIKGRLSASNRIHTSLTHSSE